jgi:hypothetical protein
LKEFKFRLKIAENLKTRQKSENPLKKGIEQVYSCQNRLKTPYTGRNPVDLEKTVKTGRKPQNRLKAAKPVESRKKRPKPVKTANPTQNPAKK